MENARVITKGTSRRWICRLPHSCWGRDLNLKISVALVGDLLILSLYIDNIFQSSCVPLCVGGRLAILLIVFIALRGQR